MERKCRYAHAPLEDVPQSKQGKQSLPFLSTAFKAHHEHCFKRSENVELLLPQLLNINPVQKFRLVVKKINTGMQLRFLTPIACKCCRNIDFSVLLPKILEEHCKGLFIAPSKFFDLFFTK